MRRSTWRLRGVARDGERESEEKDAGTGKGAGRVSATGHSGSLEQQFRECEAHPANFSERTMDAEQRRMTSEDDPASNILHARTCKDRGHAHYGQTRLGGVQVQHSCTGGTVCAYRGVRGKLFTRVSGPGTLGRTDWRRRGPLSEVQEVALA